MSHRSWVFTKLDDHQQERQTRKSKIHETSGGYIGNKISNIPSTRLKNIYLKAQNRQQKKVLIEVENFKDHRNVQVSSKH